MRTLRFEEWQARRRAFAAERSRAEHRREARSWSRGADGHEVIPRLDLDRRETWLRSGRLVRVAPRRWRIDTAVAP